MGTCPSPAPPPTYSNLFTWRPPRPGRKQVVGLWLKGNEKVTGENAVGIRCTRTLSRIFDNRGGMLLILLWEMSRDCKLFKLDITRGRLSNRLYAMFNSWNTVFFLVNILTLVCWSAESGFCWWTSWFSVYLPRWTGWNFRKISIFISFTSWFSSGQVKFRVAHLDGQVNVNSWVIIHCIFQQLLRKAFRFLCSY